MHIVLAVMELETTCRIPRDELLGLLNTMTPHDQQRITAEMQAVSPPSDLVIKFYKPSRVTRTVVIASSFVFSFAVGLFVAMLY